ncbi:MAG: phosphate signaling complex protein PhoU [Synergistaceae bacterium]|nr:phosphate signaling complex protein PhoU [Synergistaceae bacterium]
MNSFKDKEIDSLFAHVFELGTMAERSMRDAVWSLSRQDKNIARSVLEGDDDADALALEINKVSFQLIARYQPVAFDLRALEACIRMALDLERFTDLSVSVARVTLDLGTPIKPLENIQPMGEQVIRMLNTAMTALLKRDSILAKEVFAMDDEVDDFEDAAFAEVMRIAMDSPALAAGGNKLVNVARVLERAGDHVTNVAEQICYMLTGVRVRASEYRRPMKEDH